jgi:hypothetical protein
MSFLFSDSFLNILLCIFLQVYTRLVSIHLPLTPVGSNPIRNLGFFRVIKLSSLMSLRQFIILIRSSRVYVSLCGGVSVHVCIIVFAYIAFVTSKNTRDHVNFIYVCLIIMPRLAAYSLGFCIEYLHRN